jgi:hypothetical protein
MKEEYKTCPNCHNMVDKKDKQCPYCLTSLTRRNIWNSSNKTNTSNTQGTWDDNTTEDEEYNSDTGGYNGDGITIRDDKQQKKNWELPPLFQKFLDIQKAWKAWDKEARKKVIKYIIIFYVLIQLIPAIIEVIKSHFWE